MIERTDVELVTLYDRELTSHYQRAKKLMELAPKACLAEARVLLEKIVYELADSYQISLKGN
ncbi:hypothetical protein [Amphritea balenae]|uniref:Uncharacterized protein n=1 Tax=Amphritea balenae TaxID=452629 RepID=A0A3P1SMM7_9GAMM|nr:hypothetical protein [Amphritea balenae]RRC98280.1 hypothetical protein EHS89_14405 [Amphritea balenae]GGK80628.1 hypothetical protein GCM10007941_33760 [Amphritea balenae]